MSIQIANLTQQLQNALDSNYNVINMADVLQVITALEGIQITKEQLESTRLGKHINHLRRMTKNESLARRAKNLLKKWREMVLPTASPAVTSTAAPSLAAPSNPMSLMPPSSAMTVNGYTVQEHRFHQNQSTRGNVHHSVAGAGHTQNHHSNGNKKSASNSNRKFGSSSGGGGGGGGSSSGMPTNNYSCINSVNIVADQLIVDPIEADVQRRSNSNSKQRRNVGDAPIAMPPTSDPYKFLQIQNDSGESISPISISALPKIPKKSSSALSAAASSVLSVNKHNVDRSRSPLLLNSNSGIKPNQSSPSTKWPATVGGGGAGGFAQQLEHQKLLSSITDDNTVHQYDMQHHGVKSAINGRDQNFYSLNSGEKAPSGSSLGDNNSNSSSVRGDRDVLRSGTVDPSSITDRNTTVASETKKKHKKNKKEKKKKHHSSSSSAATTATTATTATEKSVDTTVTIPPAMAATTMMAVPTARVSAPAPDVFELADSLSSSSMSLFNSTNNSMKPKTNAAGDNGGNGGNGAGSRSMSRSSSTIPPADLTFSGKFTKTDGPIISIDSSSCSNSPKYAKLPSERSHSPLMAVPSRSSSPMQMKKLLANRLAGIDDNSVGQSTSALVAGPMSLPNFANDAMSQDMPDALFAPKKPTLTPANANGQMAASMVTALAATPSTAATTTAPPQPKKRGRKKGSKGVDGRLAANLAQKMQSGSQYDTLSLMSLKNQIDSMRGNAKKVKTTKELLAELQNRNTTGAGFDSSNSNVIGGGIGSNFGSRTSSPIASSHYQFVASPSEHSERSQSNSTIDMRSTTATPLSISPALSALEGAVQSESVNHRGGRGWEAPKVDANDRKHFRKSKSIPRDENSQPMDNADETGPIVVDDGPPKRTIDDDISELREQFTPIDVAALLAWHEHEMRNTVECTCKLLEVEPSDECDARETATAPADDDKTSVPKMIQTDVDIGDSAATKASSVVAHSTTLDQSTDTIAVAVALESGGPTQKVWHPPTSPVVKKPAMKSIFDLDYEEDDDPIHTFKTNNNIININNNNDNSNNNININNNHNDNDKNKSCDEPNFLHEKVKEATTTSATTHTSITSSTNAHHEPNSIGSLNVDVEDGVAIKLKSNPTLSPPEISRPVSPPSAPSAAVNADQTMMLPHMKRFEVQEDVDCKAKQLFVTSKESITEFHIVELHNACIPNVNGNWDDSDVDVSSMVKSETENSTEEAKMNAAELNEGSHENDDADDGDAVHLTESMVGLYERVVPLCNHLVMDRLPKNLRNVKLELPEIPRSPTPPPLPSPPLPSSPLHESPLVLDESVEAATNDVPHAVGACDQIAEESNEFSDVQSTNIDSQPNCESSHSKAEHNDRAVEANDAVEQPIESKDCDTEVHPAKGGVKRQRSSSESNDEGRQQKFQCTAEIAPNQTDGMLGASVDDKNVFSDRETIADELQQQPASPKQTEQPDQLEPSERSEQLSRRPIAESNISNELPSLSDQTESAEKLSRDIRFGTESPPVKKKQLKPVKYKIRRNSVEAMSGGGNEDNENESRRNGESDVGGKIILKLSRQFTADYTEDNEYDDTEYMDDDDDGSEASDYSENEDEDDDDDDDEDDDDDADDADENDDDDIQKNYEDDTSNHFITLKNFDTESDDEPIEIENENENEIDNQDNLFENIIDVDDGPEIDDDSDTVNNVMMFCKPVIDDCKSSSNLFNDTASESTPSVLAEDGGLCLTDITMPLNEQTPPNTVDPTTLLDDTFLEANVSCSEDNYDIKLNDAIDITAYTPIVSHANNGEIISEIMNNRTKRSRSCSTSSTSSTSGTSLSSSSCDSTPSQRKSKKKMKRWRRRPCPQHYRCASTSSSSSSSVSSLIELPVKSMDASIAIKPFATLTNETDLLHNENHIENNIHSNANSPTAPKCTTINDDNATILLSAPVDDPITSNKFHTVDQSSPKSTSSPLLTQSALVDVNTSEHDTNTDHKGDDDGSAVDKIVEHDDVGDDDDDVKPNAMHPLARENNGLLSSFNHLTDINASGVKENGYKFKEWYEVVHVKSYNDELLTILPYVVID